MRPKDADRMANSVDPDQSQRFLISGTDNELVLQQILHEPMFDGETLLHKASRVRLLSIL